MTAVQTLGGVEGAGLVWDVALLGAVLACAWWAITRARDWCRPGGRDARTTARHARTRDALARTTRSTR